MVIFEAVRCTKVNLSSFLERFFVVTKVYAPRKGFLFGRVKICCVSQKVLSSFWDTKLLSL